MVFPRVNTVKVEHLNKRLIEAMHLRLNRELLSEKEDHRDLFRWMRHPFKKIGIDVFARGLNQYNEACRTNEKKRYWIEETFLARSLHKKAIE